MKTKLFNYLTLGTIILVLLASCSKKDKAKPGDDNAKGAGVTADLVLPSEGTVKLTSGEMYTGLAFKKHDSTGITFAVAATVSGTDYMLLMPCLIKGTGTYHLAGEENGSDVGEETDLSELGIYMMLTVSDNEDNTTIFVATSSTLTITAINNKKVNGTFSGTLKSISGEEIVTIKNGKIDLAIKTIDGTE